MSSTLDPPDRSLCPLVRQPCGALVVVRCDSLRGKPMDLCCASKRKTPSIGNKLPDQESNSKQDRKASLLRTFTPSDMMAPKERPPSSRRKPLSAGATRETKLTDQDESKTIKTACACPLLHALTHTVLSSPAIAVAHQMALPTWCGCRT